jgi:lipase chaperone LimK
MGIVRKDAKTGINFKTFEQHQHLYMEEKQKILARTELSTEEADT